MKKFFFAALISLQILAQSGVAQAYEIAPPPEKGSAAEQEDFRVLHLYQANRSAEDCAMAETQSRPTLVGMFGPNTGVLTDREVKAVQSEASLIINKAFRLVEPFKEKYMRPRPYNVDKTLHPCISLPGGSKAYPSGHSAAGIVLAAYLAKKFPEKREIILEQGKQVGINRLIGGVHHPSDVAAGQSLGRQIAKDLANLL